MGHGRRARGAIAAALLGTLLAAVSLIPTGAHAMVGGCRSDPVVVLSNLGTLDLQASVSDNLSDVQKVVYVVHAPVGTKMLLVVNTDSLIGLKEQVQFYADDARNTFDTYTTVYTGQGKVTVTAQSLLVSLLNLNLGLSSVRGYSSQAIHTHFKTLL